MNGQIEPGELREVFDVEAFKGTIKSKAELRAVAESFLKVLRGSFLADGNTAPTRRQIAERFSRLVRIFRICRSDMRWGVDRACANLALYLQQDLAGVAWEPHARRASFAPDGEDGSPIIIPPYR